MKTPYPCIWVDANPTEVGQFYGSILPETKLLDTNNLVGMCEIMGSKLMILNGGKQYVPTPAFSFYVAIGDQHLADAIYEQFQTHSSSPPLHFTDWHLKSVTDRFGVTWIIDTSKSSSQQCVVPTLLYNNHLSVESLHYIAEIFGSTWETSSKQLNQSFCNELNLNGLKLLSVPNTWNERFKFTPGNSLVIPCDNQEEIDFLWKQLGKNGQYSKCGWLTDQRGISWQIVPAILAELMKDDGKRPRVTQAFLAMEKFDIEQLMNA